MYRNIIKPTFDFFIALLGLVVLSPIILLILVILLISDVSNPFFFQLRPGKDEKIFKLVKFKTMNDKKDSLGNLLPDAERLTKIGKIIRKTSLDEIPQLINVIKGDMSIIGPRPLLVQYLPLYDEVQKRRHIVKPGITGLAQVNGRNAISWERKFQLDVKYVETVSFWGDLKILGLTVLKVVKSEGISYEGEATMKPFKGTKNI